MTPLVALETLRVGVWSGAAGRQEVFAVAGVRSRGQVHLPGGILAFCLSSVSGFSLAASVGALTLIPSQRQLYCGIMIRTISKEL